MSNIPGLPPISRAREFHLYSRDGNRFLDMYLSDGGALLGHRPRAVAREISSALSRGLFADYPSTLGARLERLLVSGASRLGGNGREGRVFRNRERAFAAAATFFGCNLYELPVADGARPALPIDPGHSSDRVAAPCRVVIFRPFAVDSAVPGDADIVLPIVPFPGDWAPAIAYFPPRNGRGSLVPESDTLSPALLGALNRAIHNLLHSADWPGARIDSAKLKPLWTANGPYLFACCGEEQYREVYDRFLARRILLNPQFPGPSILPIIWSEGEQTLFFRSCEAAAKELFRGEF
ncbi:MAG TPA: hypothetical protein VMW87_08710 [Spirochaetia bacterium]|nr:hypothetical protein [Spirochaetia bacterium]